MDLSLPTVNDVGARPDLLSRNIAAEFRVDRDRILENRRELVGHLNALKKIHRNALILAKDAERGNFRMFPIDSKLLYCVNFQLCAKSQF